MLAYHPVYDVNHCLYRMVLILESSVHSEFQWDTFKLMDFYLLFPSLLKYIKPLPTEIRTFRGVINSIPNSYEDIPNAKRTLFDLNSLQNTAAMNLLAKNLISIELEKKNVIKRTEMQIPEKLIQSIENDEMKNQDWFKLIVDEVPLLGLRGKNGLKKRSGLMEFKYDTEDSKV